MKKLFAILLSVSLLVLLFTGCADKATSSDGSASGALDQTQKTYDVNLVLYGEMSQRMTEFSENELKEKVKEAINVNLNIQYLPWSECQGGKTELMLSAGEKFVTFTDTSFLSKCVSKGYYADLTESAQKYAQDLYKNCGGKEMFDCFSVDSKVYALPFGNKPNAGDNYVFMARDDIMEKHGIKNLETLEDIENFVSLVQAEDPAMLGVVAPIASMFYGALDSDINIYKPNDFIMLDGNQPDDDTVYNWFASDEYKQLCAITSDWVEKGIIPNDTLSNPEQPRSAFQNGQGLLFHGASYRVFEFMSTIKNTVPDATLKNFFIGDQSKKPLMSRGTYSTAFAVGAAVEGEELDAYVKLINLLQSSQEWVDFIEFGVEGKDYKLNDAGQVERLIGDTLFDSWLVDNVNFKRYPDYVTQEMLDTYSSWNDGCIMQKDIGFVFNNEPVKTEYAQLQAVHSEYLEPMTLGFVDYDSNIELALKKLDEAGLNVFIDEYQKQFSEFMKNK